jgi:hypothetical protein
MYEDTAMAYAGGGWGQPPQSPKTQRLNYFNMARGLFPYNHAPDAKSVSADDVIEAAEKIRKYIEGDAE